MIIITAAQLSNVKGESSPGYELDPRQLKNGDYAISIAVLQSEPHESKWDYLSKLPQQDLSMDDFAPLAEE